MFKIFLSTLYMAVDNYNLCKVVQLFVTFTLFIICHNITPPVTRMSGTQKMHSK